MEYMVTEFSEADHWARFYYFWGTFGAHDEEKDEGVVFLPHLSYSLV